MPKLKEVFVPGGMPSYTYQDRKQLGLESSLSNAMNRLNKFIAVAGPTKSGKTVLVRRVIPTNSSLWFEGAHISSIDAFWTAALAALGVKTPSSVASQKVSEKSGSTEINGAVKPLGIGGEFKQVNIDKSLLASTVTEQTQVSKAQSAIAALRAAKKVVVIDDFHYISPEVQTDIIRSLKQAVFDSLTVVLLLIPHRMHQAARAEMDVDGRTHTISIPDWQPTELFGIAESGFRALSVKYTAWIIDTLVQDSFRSPFLMQDFCSQLCSDIDVWETDATGTKTIQFIGGEDDFFRRLAADISPDAFKALQKGPERTNRKDRPLRTGGSCDTYEAVLLALQHTGVMTPMRWSDLRTALQDLLVEEPQQHEITRVLEKMDEIAKSRDGEPVLDYMKEQRELHLVDPFFRFYLKWSPIVSNGQTP